MTDRDRVLDELVAYLGPMPWGDALRSLRAEVADLKLRAARDHRIYDTLKDDMAKMQHERDALGLRVKELRAAAATDAATIAGLRRAIAAVMAEALDARIRDSNQRLAVAIDLLATAAQEPTP